MTDKMIEVPESAVDWLKTHFPDLCVKAGLCERVAGRLYTLTRLRAPAKEAAQPSIDPIAKLTPRHWRLIDLALWRLIHDAYSQARFAAQAVDKMRWKPEDADKFLQDAKDAEEARGIVMTAIAVNGWSYSVAKKAQSKNVGHGHVFPRPDGVKARCGGPGVCKECSREAAQLSLDRAKETGNMQEFVTGYHLADEELRRDAEQSRLEKLADTLTKMDQDGNKWISTVAAASMVWAAIAAEKREGA